MFLLSEMIKALALVCGDCCNGIGWIYYFARSWGLRAEGRKAWLVVLLEHMHEGGTMRRRGRCIRKGHKAVSRCPVHCRVIANWNSGYDVISSVLMKSFLVGMLNGPRGQSCNVRGSCLGIST
jgi:hypothetical protein